MAVGYKAIQWTASKRAYDLVLVALLAAGVGGFIAVAAAMHPRMTIETLLIRATAFGAFALLTLILCLGPLARFDRRFLPLVYNRRHLGVAMFLLALVHAVLAIVQFHALGDTNPLVSVFTAYAQDYDPFVTQSGNISHFPFEPLGLAALIILFLMAATSHDFWLANLGAGWWKQLH
ncbi:MAG: ferric reductase-like transmembrane domain-containing protein, partial [Acidobacteriota bacterium]